jgi:hypothetical protein
VGGHLQAAVVSRAARASATAPVEYAVAVDRYLAEASLGAASRRVYRISLTSWAWALVGQPAPQGAERRGAVPPVVPMALLDQPEAGDRLAAALAGRELVSDVRTVNRELSALRSAISWWQFRDWVHADPTADLRRPISPLTPLQPLSSTEIATLFRLPAGLREQAFWHVLRDSGASAETVLALNAGMVDGRSRHARTAADAQPVAWSAGTWQLLSWLLAGRRDGPVFLTDRRAPVGTSAGDVCPLTGRGRMSYRRAAEIFTHHTRSLDPAGRGWMLHQLRGQAAALTA